MLSRILCVFVLVFSISGCQSMYNSAMEQFFGMEKRELFRKAVQDVNNNQKKAQETFKDSMTQLKEFYNFSGGNLEAMYNRIKSSYDGSQAQADKVHDRIANMNNIAKSMFAEWEREIRSYTNETFKENSRQQLNETKDRYAQLYKSVRESENSMKSVLKQLNDHVLYLKHNLNSSAIGVLKGETTSINSNIQELIERMNGSIEEADGFIQTLLTQ